jgi:hypothetical protein
VTIDLDSNSLTGTLSTELGTITRLNILMLEGNKLEGTIPTELGVLELLSYLTLADNALTGTLPSEIGQLGELRKFPSVISFWFCIKSQSYLRIAMPSPFLVAFTAHNNALEGTIPLELTQNTLLETLSLYGNNLAGPIPSELGLMTNLELLLLQYNGFTGTMPAEICALRNQNLLQLIANCAGDNPPVVCPQPSCCTLCV